MKEFVVLDRSCYRRREEIAMVRNFLRANAWRESGCLERADLVLFFSCAGLRHLIEARLQEIAKTGRRLKPGAELIVGSCLPGMDRASLDRVFQGKSITPTSFQALNGLPGITKRIETMPAIWGEAAGCHAWPRPKWNDTVRMLTRNAILQLLKLGVSIHSSHLLKRAILGLQRRGTVAFSIAAGCARRCAYCAKPLASGPVRSKPIEAVVQSLQEGLRLGYRAFDLYADSIGNYGLDQRVTFGDLLARLLRLKGRFSLGLFDVHPQDFLRDFDSIRRLCRAGRLHYLYVPVQSGNGRILKLMHRSCDLSELIEKLTEIRRCPHVFMQTGIIVGFPGETEAEFEDTIRFLRRVDFDDVYVHLYCDMPDTEASRLTERVGEADLWRRLSAIEQAGFRYNPVTARNEWEKTLSRRDEAAL